jgi:cell wall-associated NlpC family hydrolase
MINILLKEARSWIDTPWVHNHRVKGQGVDCINFIAACAETVGIYLPIPVFYEKNPEQDYLMEAMGFYLRPLQQKTPTIGNIVAFNYCGIIHHVAIASGENTIIHASAQHHRVLEQEITKQQERRIVDCYAMKIE